MAKNISRKDFLKTALTVLLGATLMSAQRLFAAVNKKDGKKEAKYYKRLDNLAG